MCTRHSEYPSPLSPKYASSTCCCCSGLAPASATAAASVNAPPKPTIGWLFPDWAPTASRISVGWPGAAAGAKPGVTSWSGSCVSRRLLPSAVSHTLATGGVGAAAVVE